jgi:hypothetical protein
VPVLTIALGGVRVLVEHEGERSAAVVDHLFREVSVPVEVAAEPDAALRLASDEAGLLVLSEGDAVLRRGAGGDVADALLSRVCFHLADRNRTGLVLHAGAVAIEDAAVIVAGASGAGKTTLTAWLLSRGARYMSDEIVVVREAPEIEALPRALHVKTGAREALDAIAARPLDPGHLLGVPDGLLVSPARFGASVEPGPMHARALIFPRFDGAAPSSLRRLTAAEAGYRLVEVLANARNLPGHGFSQAVALARAVPAWSLDYGGFEGLGAELAPVLEAVAAPR